MLRAGSGGGGAGLHGQIDDFSRASGAPFTLPAHPGKHKAERRYRNPEDRHHPDCRPLNATDNV